MNASTMSVFRDLGIFSVVFRSNTSVSYPYEYVSFLSRYSTCTLCDRPRLGTDNLHLYLLPLFGRPHQGTITTGPHQRH